MKPRVWGYHRLKKLVVLLLCSSQRLQPSGLSFCPSSTAQKSSVDHTEPEKVIEVFFYVSLEGPSTF